ncbi:Endonuclease/exonuclease/phosphatase [Macleaya cordata]|uniref:Endonuclease/exonuclease/phosphatase n=1 Tax=Macleaya cordata TaxID=56857 RepID=A0A200QPF5_MACCD|nr:Endonuclease/exonuclease/phosphatase [Macleaya cordata]
MFAAANSLLWILMGDFNSILDSQEKVGGTAIRPYHFADFHNCVSQAHIFDLAYTGCFFTWSNNQLSDGRISKTLDRAMVNAEWLQYFQDSTADFLPPGLSDHSPIITSIFFNREKHPRPFRFYNSWVSELGFMEVVISTWSERVRGRPGKSNPNSPTRS